MPLLFCPQWLKGSRKPRLFCIHMHAKLCAHFAAGVAAHPARHAGGLPALGGGGARHHSGGWLVCRLLRFLKERSILV